MTSESISDSDIIDLRPRKLGHGQRPDPTPAEIAEACQQIQAEWDEREELQRRVIPHQPARVPEVSCGE